MQLTRRNFLGTLASVATIPTLSSIAAELDDQKAPVRALAFDGFVIFDPRIIAKRAEQILPTRGAQLAELWRTTIFEYTWILTSANQYKDFWQVTNDALAFALATLNIEASAAQRRELMDIWKALPAWPDVPEALENLKKRGLRLAFLSNLTAELLDANLRANKLTGYFERHLSTDRVRAYKPSPKAYQMGIDHFRYPKEQIAFLAFGSWDATGAKWFGYPTTWVNRLGVQPIKIGLTPDTTTSTLKEAKLW